MWVYACECVCKTSGSKKMCPAWDYTQLNGNNTCAKILSISWYKFKKVIIII